MKRDHLIQTILSAVFPSGSIPLVFLDRIPRLVLLAGALADEVGPDVPSAAPVSPSEPSIVVAKRETPEASAPPAAQVRSETGIDWDNEPRLGTMSDEKLAYALGVSRKTVTRARVLRGLKSPNPSDNIGRRLGIDWDNEPRLGVMGDTALARELGCSAVTVLTARRNRGLPSPVPASVRKPESVPPVKINKSGRPSSRNKGVDWDAEPRLGQVVDSVLATKYGVTSQTVFNARKKRGIPAWTTADASPAEAQDPKTEPAPSIVTTLSAPPPAAVVSIPERTAAPPPVDRQRELDIIEQHIKTKGVTKITNRYVEPDSIPASPKGRGGLV